MACALAQGNAILPLMKLFSQPVWCPDHLLQLLPLLLLLLLLLPAF
jgi:hypothetical protein